MFHSGHIGSAGVASIAEVASSCVVMASNEGYSGASPVLSGVKIEGSEMYDSFSDARLLGKACNDAEAFVVFYVRNYRRILSYFWSRTRDREVSADLTAETFAGALIGLDRYDPTKGTPKQWLYGIANNQLKAMWRSHQVSLRARHRLEVMAPAIADSGGEEFERIEAAIDSDRLGNALAKVPAKSREAVRLRIIDQLDYGEIARRMGCERGSARSLVLRGLRRLGGEFDRPSGNDSRRQGSAG